MTTSRTSAPRFEQLTVCGIRAFYMNDEAADNGCEAIDSEMPAWTNGKNIEPSDGHYRHGISDNAPSWATCVIIDE